MSPREFLAQLDEDELDFIHHMHVDENASMISMSRTRTKPITARTKGDTVPPRAKTTTIPQPRVVTRTRMKRLTKP